jgi:general secretion pathway protein C
MLQVKDGSTHSFWPALCATGASAMAAYALVSWFLQIQSLSSPASKVPVVMNTASDKAMTDTGPNVQANAQTNAQVAHALGAAQPASKDNASSSAPQWNLLGVVAGVSSGQGSALIVVDGQPAKAFLPGQTVAPGWVLHSVGHRLARLAPSLQEAPSVTLELPK